jgi:hypothetical protein
MIAALSCGTSATAAFRPDRAALLEQCVMHDFRQVSKTLAVPARATRLTADQRAAIASILDVWAERGDNDKRKLAYILATARRESQGSWRPIREAPGCGTDERCRERAISRLLASRAKLGKAPRPNYAKPAANGQRYYGRGFIQLTHEGSYLRAGEKLGMGSNLHDHPDRVMESPIAQTILVRAMMEGWYGNKKPLSFYFNDLQNDWLNARNSVNPGSPHKPIMAASAREINACLKPL